MRIADHLSKEQKQQLNNLCKPPEKKPITKPITKTKKKENLSFRELENMMGKYRDTYERRNGAVKRK